MTIDESPTTTTSATNSSIGVLPLAVSKILLHVKKNPIGAVLNGLLVGKSVPGSSVVMEDAFPCFHTTPTTLNLPLEIYLSQVKSKVV